jgi:hypothetical protein
MKIGNGARQGSCLSPILSTCTVCTLPRKFLHGFETSKIGGQVIHTVKYTDDLVLLAKEEVLQDMTERLSENG